MSMRIGPRQDALIFLKELPCSYVTAPGCLRREHNDIDLRGYAHGWDGWPTSESAGYACEGDLPGRIAGGSGVSTGTIGG